MEKDWTKNCDHVDIQQFVRNMDQLEKGKTRKCPFCENGVVTMVKQTGNYRKFACDCCDMYYETENN